jgi:hypothetical protein
MKKFLTTVTILAAMAAVATAGVGIQWQTGYGGYDHTVSPPLTGGTGAILDSYSVIWQLIYAGADNINNPIPNAPGDPLPVAGGANGDYVQGDDVVWAQRTIALGGGTAAEDGSVWDNWMYRVGTAGDTTYVDLSWNTAGFVYQRVFEGTPTWSSYYYDSPLFAFDETWTDSLPPEGFNTEPAQGAGFQASSTMPPAVPEPATMGLLGLGALVMAFRRRRA